MTARRRGETVEIPAFGYRMLVDPEATFSSDWVYYGPLKDFDLANFLLRYLHPDDNFIDVGANVGIYSLLASSILKSGSGKVFAFEPSPATYERLARNLTANSIQNVTAYQFGLSDSDASLGFVDGLDQVSHLAEPGVAGTTNIRVRRGADILPPLAYSLAKIDVEGYELPVVRGLTPLLGAEGIPVLAVEINGGSDRFEFSSQELIGVLDVHGYVPMSFSADSGELSPSETPWDDVLFVHRDHLESVRQRISVQQ